MYKWKIEFTLASGKEITGVYSCDARNSSAVAQDVLAGSIDEFFGMLTPDGKGNLLVKRRDVAAAIISVFNEKGTNVPVIDEWCTLTNEKEKENV